jgi:hypothetical protein
VTHLDVDRNDIQAAAAAVKQFMAQGRAVRPAAA